MQNQTILRYKHLTQRLKLSRSTIHRLLARQAFPNPIVLSSHAVGFLESDIDAWVASREIVRASTGKVS
jgi:prophage regulatory protein